MKSKIQIVFAGIIIAIMASCATSKGFRGKADLHGMVCNIENLPMEGYSISIGGKKCAMTNSNGLFIIPNIGSGKIIIKGEKEGWETFEINENFVDKNELFCIQVRSFDQILEQVENEIDNKNYFEAKKILELQEKENRNNKKIVIYKAVIAYKMNELDESIYCIKKIKNNCESKEKIEKTLEILKKKKKEMKDEAKK